MKVIHLRAVAPCKTCGKWAFVEGDPATQEELERANANPCLGHSPHCPCVDWEPGMKAINGAIMMSAIHGGIYSGAPFVRCPWCGGKLEPRP